MKNLFFLLKLIYNNKYHLKNGRNHIKTYINYHFEKFFNYSTNYVIKYCVNI